MGVHKCVEPSPGFFIPNLDDVREGGGTIGLDQILYGGRVAVVTSIERVLSFSDSRLQRY